MTLSLEPYLNFAREITYQAAQLTLPYFHNGVAVDTKSDGTPVTQADRLAEQYLRGQIESRYPAHAILGEEYGEDSRSASHRWIIDPIDGTKSFIHGVPLYGVLVGLEIDGEVRVGAVAYPPLDGMLWAADGLGCWYNGRRVHTAPLQRFSEATVCYTNVLNFAKHSRLAAWERIQRAAKMVAGWGDAYGYLLVATGRAGVMLDPAMAVWDCGPFPPIFREAGGYFGDWSGSPTIYAGEAIACPESLLAELLTLIGEKE